MRSRIYKNELFMRGDLWLSCLFLISGWSCSGSMNFEHVTHFMRYLAGMPSTKLGSFMCRSKALCNEKNRWKLLYRVRQSSITCIMRHMRSIWRACVGWFQMSKKIASEISSDRREMLARKGDCLSLRNRFRVNSMSGIFCCSQLSRNVRALAKTFAEKSRNPLSLEPCRQKLLLN